MDRDLHRDLVFGSVCCLHSYDDTTNGQSELGSRSPLSHPYHQARRRVVRPPDLRTSSAEQMMHLDGARGRAWLLGKRDIAALALPRTGAPASAWPGARFRVKAVT
jgi:hypothetical protein